MFRQSNFIRLSLGSIIMTAMLFSVAVYAAGFTRAQESSPQAKPKRISPDDLKKLRWIEGAWRGTGDVEKPFYERYRFEGTTLVVESFKDETLSKIDDVTRFELRDEQFGNYGEGARWTATRLTDDSITFEPVAKARNSFRWQHESKDVWKAVLDWPAMEGKPARQRVYRMERLPQTKAADKQSGAMSKAEEELRELERTRSRAIREGDMKTLDAIYADDFSGIVGTGQVINKEQLLAVFKRNDPSLHFTTDEINIRVFNETAVFTGRLAAITGSGVVAFASRFTHVFVKRDGRWQCVAGQSTVIAKT